MTFGYCLPPDEWKTRFAFIASIRQPFSVEICDTVSCGKSLVRMAHINFFYDRVAIQYDQQMDVVMACVKSLDQGQCSVCD